MDIRKIKKLIELLEESNIEELEIHEGEESVRISRGSTTNVAVTHLSLKRQLRQPRRQQPAQAMKYSLRW